MSKLSELRKQCDALVAACEAAMSYFAKDDAQRTDMEEERVFYQMEAALADALRCRDQGERGKG